MSVKGSLAVELLKFLLGKSDPIGLLISVVAILIANPIIFTELSNMEFFYIPEGMLVWMIAIMAAVGILASIGWAGRFKHLHGRDEDWKMKYVASMFLNMIIAPIAANIALSIIAQELAVALNPLSYLFMLVIAIIIMSALVLILLNYGPKYLWSALKVQAKEVKDIADEVEANRIRQV